MPFSFPRAVFFFCVSALLLSGCAKCPVPCQKPYEIRDATIKDLRTIPQNLDYFARQVGAQKLLLPPERRRELADVFLKRFFSPWKWEKSALTAAQAFWGRDSYSNKTGYGENKLPRDTAWFRSVVALARPEAFPSLAHKGILVRDCALRVFPTNKPFFYNFDWAGEGYPFDYFQLSFLPAGTPLFISHQSADGAWLFVESALVSGWVRTRDTAAVDADFIAAYTTGAYVTVLADDVPLRTAQGRFVLKTRLGALFPRGRGKQGGKDALLVPVRDFSGRALLIPCVLPARRCAPFPLAATPGNIARAAACLPGRPYGWGGLYGDRDCSAMLRDLYVPFGIWLPRNSAAQARAGSVLDLEGLSRTDKEKTVLEKGVPFFSLVGMRGHIMLYVGRFNGRAVVFQNIWGLRLKNANPACERSGRLIIGRAVCTTLDPGTEVDAVRKADVRLIDRILTLTRLE